MTTHLAPFFTFASRAVLQFTWRVVASLLFFFFLTATPASAQDTACYTDAWPDTITSPGNVYLDGCGITDAALINWKYMDAWVTTTITSPNGRQASATDGDPQTPFAMVLTSLRLRENDLGDYSVDSLHWSECPIGYFAPSFIGISYSRSAYQIVGQEGQRCLYSATCNGTCSVSRWTDILIGTECGVGNYVQCYDLRINGNCTWPHVYCRDILGPGVCD